ncbi:MAG: hypothetical protein R6U98_14080 [Pirellulaceae bacterium]
MNIWSPTTIRRTPGSSSGIPPHLYRRGYSAGQLGVDLSAHVLSPSIEDYSSGGWSLPGGKRRDASRPPVGRTRGGESHPRPVYQDREWGWRGADSGARRETKGEAYERKFFGAWVPENFEPGSWGHHDGEMAKWLRLRGRAGRTDWLVVLMPRRHGDPAPRVKQLSPTSARITKGNESEIVHLGTQGKHQAAVQRQDTTKVLIENKALGGFLRQSKKDG